MKLTNEISLITGAASGIGKAQALLFAKEGAKIIAVDIQSDKLQQTVSEIKADGGDAIGIPTDITSESDVKYLYEQSIREYGKISILCNTAGAFDYMVPLAHTDLTLLRKILSVNVEGSFLVTKYILQDMVKNKYGVVVNMASAAGLIGGGAGMAYTISKHALIGFTRQINAEMGHLGIRANAIAPGLIHTPMVQDFMVEGSPVMDTFQKIPGCRVGEPIDVALASLFLASRDAAYIYGETIQVDGGLLSALRF